MSIKDKLIEVVSSWFGGSGVKDHLSDTVSSWVGGAGISVVAFVVNAEVLNVITLLIVALVGGFLGTFGKNAGAYAWQKLKNRFEGKKKKED